MKAKIRSTCILLLAVAACQQMASTTQAAVTFSVTPSAVSNTYTGFITFQIGGLNSNETVVVQEFVDLNTNGVIDAGDWLVQQFQLTDGQPGMVIGGIVNSNVPGDTTPTNGAITAQMSILTRGPGMSSFAGQYLYKLSSPSGRFAPVTNLFSITNLPYSQSITGNVVCSGSNVPNALVMAFSGPVFNSSPIAGTMGNNAGGYSLPLPPGTYALIAVKSSFVANLGTAPTVVVGSGAKANTNLTLSATTCSISGKMVDATNASVGLPGIWMFPQSTNSLIAVGITDTNGNFTARATASQWKVSCNDDQLPALGYVRVQDRPEVDTTTGSVANVTIELPKATALFYGSVKDNLGSPMVGIDVEGYDSNNQYDSTGYTDANGNYAAAALGGLGDDSWQLQISSDSSPANYIFSFPSFSQNGGTNLAVGQAVQCSFVGLVTTEHITGYVTNAVTGQGIANVGVPAWATINGVQFMAYARTDNNGFYSNNVANGTWNVDVNCGDCSDCLGSQYLCPNGQTVTIANKNGTANFAALLPTSQIDGYVKDNGNNPIANVGVYAYMPTGGGNGPGPGATTDGNGYYSFYVANGGWNVGLNCCGNNALSPLGYLCVGEQSTTVNNSTNVVNFTVPHAPYQITGYLRDAANNPIANVTVNANNSSYSACATTASDGSYTLYVNNGSWNVNLDCNALAALGYLCPGGQSVTVSNANAVLDFSTVQAPYQITGWVRDNNNQPFTNVDVYAYATIGTNSYWLDSYTDGSGNYSFQVADGQWGVGVDCGGLGSGYQCPNDVTVNIADASIVTNFIIQPCGQLQILTTSLPAGQVGSYYDFYLQASSCYPNFIWSLSSSSLPPGLTEDSSSGEIYGTPTNAGTFNFTVQVTDANNATTNQALSITISPSPADVGDYFVMKMESFFQLGAANVVPDTNHGPFTGILGIVQASPGTLLIANVDLPTGAVRGFPSGSTGIELLTYDSYPTEAALDAVYGNGNYTFVMDTVHNGLESPVLTMPASAYPAAQRISNFAAAQAINPTSPFTLQWSNPSDATTNDWIWVFVNDGSGHTVFSSPEPSTNPLTALNGTATSIVVPAGTFQLGAAYTGAITFYRNTSVNTTGYPGAVGVTLIGTRTRFSLAASSSFPVLSQPTRISSTQFGFFLSGATGQNYTVLAATNAARPLTNWSTLLITNLSASPALIQDNQATNKQRFYRVKVGP